MNDEPAQGPKSEPTFAELPAGDGVLRGDTCHLDVIDRSVVGWLEVGDSGKQVTVRDLPQREHIDVPVRESLIVELYSK